MSDSRLSQSDAELQSHVMRVLESQYEVEKEIGRGGMGIVYGGRDKRLKRPVAIKLLPPELAFRSEIRSRFLREAEMAAQLSHPHIVPIYSVDEREGLVYFVMALVEGENLGTRIANRGPVTPEEARRILREVGDALAYAHSQNTVHRDIKPDNILIDRATGRTMVTDFGIARAVSEGGDSKLTATGIAIGTPAYMSPEQSAGDRDIDGRTDLYALGIVAYQMLCGDLPFNATSAPALLVKHLSEKPVPIDQRAMVPPDLARAVMLCLEKNPDDRFPDARAFVQALETGNVPQLPQRMGNAYPQAQPTWTPPANFDPDAPTPEELVRWEHRTVVAFRKAIAPFLFVTGALFFVNFLGGPNFLFVSAFWGINIAYKYARLWSDGFDWRDVFRQPRDKMIVDVAADTVDSAKAIWDREKRMEIREKARRRRLSVESASPAGGLPGITSADAAALGSGPHAATARQALLDREEVLRLVDSLPSADKARIPDVVPTARSLSESVMGLATALTTVERELGDATVAAMDKEISMLESQANPLDVQASEARVRRLALLKRSRRGAAELEARRAELAAKLENVALTLQNLKFDVLRLKTGNQSWQQLTTVAERAAALAREVDASVYAGDQLARIDRGRTRG
ncbi:protein kinase [Pseudogemmatithrix spongiicola]|uniref:non-specific serine/threonine protein kinase n=1 Tax=Pseudogemmatithrix spongiicola TaxID=3062599 RepID=A0AA49K2D5_9BACT|nr:protein kinase [Gemmatimonadaceae bacterium 'strain 138']WKW16234.1 protein kinase [Gemmatimonadaceae bacterium 'strain 318']